MGHVLIMGIHNIDRAFLFKFIGTLHMPLFFFISGYFSYKLIEGKIAYPNMLNRFKQLIVPFFFVSMLWIYYFPHSGIESPLISSWQGLYSDSSKNGYWFTLCLFEMMLIFLSLIPIFNRVKNTILQVLIIGVIYFLINIFIQYGNDDISNYLSLPLMIIYLPIFFIGIFAQKYKQLFEDSLKNNAFFTTSIIIGSLAIYYTCYFWEFPQLPSFITNLITTISHLSVVIIAFTVIKPWCEKAYATNKPSFAIRALQYIGKESLSIYLLHYFFLFPMTAFRQPMIDMGLGFTPLFVVSIITSVIIITMVLGVKSIIERSKLLSLLLLGKG